MRVSAALILRLRAIVAETTVAMADLQRVRAEALAALEDLNADVPPTSRKRSGQCPVCGVVPVAAWTTDGAGLCRAGHVLAPQR